MEEKILLKIIGLDLQIFSTCLLYLRYQSVMFFCICLPLCSIDIQVLNDKDLTHVELQYLMTSNYANALQLLFHIFSVFIFLHGSKFA